jgi:hypothetical protein
VSGLSACEGRALTCGLAQGTAGVVHDDDPVAAAVVDTRRPTQVDALLDRRVIASCAHPPRIAAIATTHAASATTSRGRPCRSPRGTYHRFCAALDRVDPARRVRRRGRAFARTFHSSGRRRANLRGRRGELSGLPALLARAELRRHDIEDIRGLEGQGTAVVVTYGTCDISGFESSCASPLQLQISPLCDNLISVTRSQIWRTRKIRGAPVGTEDNAPVLYSRRIQIKVYRGEGTDSGRRSGR